MYLSPLNDKEATRYADKAVFNAPDDADINLVRENAYRTFVSKKGGDRLSPTCTKKSYN